MGFQLALVFVLLALGAVAESSFSTARDMTWDLTSISEDGGSRRGCENGLVGDCVDPEEEGMMATEDARRILARGRRVISYGALARDRVPCSRRGRSYYNCGVSGRANPYRRGCSAITRCARYTG